MNKKYILFERKKYKEFPQIRFESVGNVYSSTAGAIAYAKENNMKEFKIKRNTGKKDILGNLIIEQFEFGY